MDARRRQLIVGAGLALLTTAAPVFPARARVLEPRKRGSAVISVRDHGARGDGRKDETAAFQAAIDALPMEGGTVVVPDGTYVIDAIKNLRLRSWMHLQLSAGAVLQAKPNGAIRYYVLIADRVSDVEISGGRIVGDRDDHLGTTGEWGHGIYVRGSRRVTVRNIHISKCWGDGMSIGQAIVRGVPLILSEDVVVANIVSTGNRRQGLSIGASRNVEVYDSEFSYTNGTAPECGIDIEPDIKGLTTCEDVHIENCLLRHNNTVGIMIYKRVTGVTLRSNTIELNGGYGIYTVSPVGGHITRNTIQHNYWGGVILTAATKDYQVIGNYFRNNKTRSFGFRPVPSRVKVMTGIVAGKGGTGGQIEQTSDCANIMIGSNYYSN